MKTIIIIKLCLISLLACTSPSKPESEFYLTVRPADCASCELSSRSIISFFEHNKIDYTLVSFEKLRPNEIKWVKDKFNCTSCRLIYDEKLLNSLLETEDNRQMGLFYKKNDSIQYLGLVRGIDTNSLKSLIEEQ